MSIAFKCSCGRALQAKPEMAGKKTKCPGCGSILTIPSGASAPTAAKPAAPKTAPAAPAAAAAVPEIVACQCGAKIRTKPEWAGKSIKCPKCASLIKIPAGAPAAAPVAPPRPAPKPAPIEDSDPFDGGAIPGPSDDGFDEFSDEGDSGDNEPAVPARKRASAPPPKKKSSIGRLLLWLVLLIVLAGGGFAAYCHFVEKVNPIDFVLGKTPQPTFKAPPPVVKDDGKKGKTDDEKKSKTSGTDDPETKDPETKDPVVKDPPPVKDPEVKDPEIKNPDPKTPVEPIPPAGVANPITYVAANSAGFVSVKPQALFETKIGKQFLAQMFEGPGKEKDKADFELIGVSPADITGVAVAAPKIPMDDWKAATFVVSFGKPINRAGLEKVEEVEKKATPNGLPYYVNKKGPGESVAISIAGDRVAIVSEEQALVAFLTAQRPKDGAMAGAIKNANDNEHFVFVAAQLDKAMMAGLVDGTPEPFKDKAATIAEATSAEVVVTAGPTIKMVVKFDYAAGEKAEAAKKSMDELIEIGKMIVPMLTKNPPPQFKKLVPIGEDAFKSIVPSVAGSSLLVPMEVKMSLDEILETAVPMFMVEKKKSATSKIPADVKKEPLPDLPDIKPDVEPKAEPKKDVDPKLDQLDVSSLTWGRLSSLPEPALALCISTRGTPRSGC